MMLKRLFFLSILSVLLLSACNSNDELSGKIFDVSVISGPNEPDKYSPIMTLEFSDGNKVKNKMGYEEGMYELKDDKLVIQFENENEYLEIEFTLEESDNEFSEYSAEISDSKLKIDDSSLVSKLKGFYEKIHRSHFEFIEV